MDIKITFGIITSESTSNYLNSIISSIRDQRIDKGSYEILIVGNCNIESSEEIRVIPFNENHKNLWITRKKNLITHESKFDIIVYMHDYLSLDENWYSNFIKFGNDWDLCMNKIVNKDGNRILDWMGLPDDNIYGNVLFPYSYEGSDGMYIPGYFWIAKKSVMKEFPMNEEFLWGEGEDIEWSKRVLGGFPPRWLKNLDSFESGKIKIKKHRYLMNEFSIVKSLKEKQFHPNFSNTYDLHSGDESRPLESISDNYKYLEYRNEKINNI
jgi:hypothetical protein